MSTIYQSIIARKSRKRRRNSPALCGCPQKKGICIKATTMKPKKPNSAIRKIAKVRLSTRARVIAYVPGWHSSSTSPVQEHATVLIRGGRIRDLPGVHYKLVKGKFDFSWMEAILRRQSRSKYGAPSPKKQAWLG